MPASHPFKIGDSVVAYVRYSGGSEQTAKDRSAKEQAADIQAFCDANGLILHKVFEDAGLSGTSTRGHGAFSTILSPADQLREQLQDPAVSVVEMRDLLKLFIQEVQVVTDNSAILRYHLPKSCADNFAPLEGIEPATNCLEGRCSVH